MIIKIEGFSKDDLYKIVAAIKTVIQYAGSDKKARDTLQEMLDKFTAAEIISE